MITSNAAPVIHDDSSVTLFYKSVHQDWQSTSLDEEDRPKFIIGAARADKVFAEYRRLGEEDGMINVEERHIALEDPTAWHDGTYYRMIVKNFYTLSDERAAGLYLMSLRKLTSYAKVVLRRRQEQGMQALSAGSLLVVNDCCLR